MGYREASDAVEPTATEPRQYKDVSDDDSNRQSPSIRRATIATLLARAEASSIESDVINGKAQ
jgi:hypothetical protein